MEPKRHVLIAMSITTTPIVTPKKNVTVKMKLKVARPNFVNNLKSQPLSNTKVLKN